MPYKIASGPMSFCQTFVKIQRAEVRVLPHDLAAFIFPSSDVKLVGSLNAKEGTPDRRQHSPLYCVQLINLRFLTSGEPTWLLSSSKSGSFCSLLRSHKICSTRRRYSTKEYQLDPPMHSAIGNVRNVPS